MTPRSNSIVLAAMLVGLSFSSVEGQIRLSDNAGVNTSVASLPPQESQPSQAPANPSVQGQTPNRPPAPRPQNTGPAQNTPGTQQGQSPTRQTSPQTGPRSNNPNQVNFNDLSRSSTRNRSQSSGRFSLRNERFTAQNDVPNMLGDSTGPTSNLILVQGGQLALIEHPTLGQSRLNLAENSSPLLRNRNYFNYRHFHNSSILGVETGPGVVEVRDFEVDRFVLGFERIFGDVNSIEVRIPTSLQMSSNLQFTQTGNGNGPPVTSFPTTDTSMELGNIGAIWKRQLIQSGFLTINGGAGVNLPTGRDVVFTSVISDTNYTADGSTFNDLDWTHRTRVSNDTVSLVPFLSAAFIPAPNWFMQGFLQVDVPLNESTVTVDSTAVFNGSFPFTESASFTDDFAQQSVVRFNGSIGRWLWRGDTQRLIQSAGFVFECHYSSTLNDGQFVGTQAINSDLGNGESFIGAGNPFNRQHNLNVVGGIPLVIGNTAINLGVVAPVGQNDDDRGFDFEFTFSIDRRL